jgi:rhodanese-related sulfurtransferase
MHPTAHLHHPRRLPGQCSARTRRVHASWEERPANRVYHAINRFGIEGRLAPGHMATALALAMVAVGTWLAWKLWRKFRFRRLQAIPQITVAELVAAMSSEQPPLVLDLRGPAMISDAGPIPGTQAVEHERVREAVAGWPSDRLIVTLCACPEDTGAILAARDLLDDGFLSVKPLRGRYEAWVAATR